MGPDEANVRAPGDGCAGKQTDNRAGRIENKLHPAILSIAKDSLGAARGAVGMAKHHSLSPVQLIHHGSKCGIAKIFAPVTRKHARAVSLERIEGVFDFAQRAFNVW